jgi:hypothetical protein
MVHGVVPARRHALGAAQVRRLVAATGGIALGVPRRLVLFLGHLGRGVGFILAVGRDVPGEVGGGGLRGCWGGGRGCRAV